MVGGGGGEWVGVGTLPNSDVTQIMLCCAVPGERGSEGGRERVEERERERERVEQKERERERQ